MKGAENRRDLAEHALKKKDSRRAFLFGGAPMKYAGILLLAVGAVTTAALAAFGPLAPVGEATLPPGPPSPCPELPGGGAILSVGSATLPTAAGQNANGVCIVMRGTGDGHNTATLLTNAAGCGATLPTVGAGGHSVWADWGTNNCVAPGDTVTIQFKSVKGGGAVTAVYWSLADGSVFVQGGSVGGFAELPAVAETGASGMGGATYAVLAGAAAGVLAFAVLATLAVRRWRVR
jgi:hypothetical protein